MSSLISWFLSWLPTPARIKDIRRYYWLRHDGRHALRNKKDTFWVNVQPFLAAKGYALRPRFQPDWVPSWRLTGASPILSEDGDGLVGRGVVIDALRVQDNTRVALKRVRKTPRGEQEVETMAYFNEARRRSDRRNRCVPLLVIFDPGSTYDSCIIVMPLLQNILSIDFRNLDEVFELLGQLFEGLSFMHSHNLEHRDICLGNVMMYAEQLYPEGHHPTRSTLKADDDRLLAPHLYRSDVSIQYYYIDFGLSNLHESFEDRELVLMPRGQDRSAPEFQDGGPTDGFALDVYCLGNLIRKSFLDISPLLRDFLGPLLAGMTVERPSERYTAQESFRLFEEIRGSLSKKQLFRRLCPPNETFTSAVWPDVLYFWDRLKRRMWPKYFGYLTTTYKNFAHVPYVIEPCSYAAEMGWGGDGRELPMPVFEDDVEPADVIPGQEIRRA